MAKKKGTSGGNFMDISKPLNIGSSKLIFTNPQPCAFFLMQNATITTIQAQITP